MVSRCYAAGCEVGDGAARPRALGASRARQAKLLHRSARHGHVRIKDVALGHPFSGHLLRGQHPLAVVNMGTVSPRGHIRPGAIADIAAALGGSDGDLDLGGAMILAGLELRQDSIPAMDGAATSDLSAASAGIESSAHNITTNPQPEIRFISVSSFSESTGILSN